MITGAAVLMTMLVAFLLLPMRTAWKYCKNGELKFKMRDLIWLGIYGFTGIRTMRAFAMYLMAKGLI